MKISKPFNQWYNGKDVRTNPDEPDTLGGMSVMHAHTKKVHWTAKIARSLVAFYLIHWKWLWGILVPIMLAIFFSA